MKKLVITAAFLFFATSAFSAVVQRPATDFPVITPVSDDYWLLTDTSNTGRFSRVATSGVRAALGLGAADNASFASVTATGAGGLVSGVAGSQQGSLILYSNADIYPLGFLPAPTPTAAVTLKFPPAMPTVDNALLNFDINGTGGWTDPAAFAGISHATSDGNYYGSKDGAWVNLGAIFYTETEITALLAVKADKENIAFNAASFSDLTITGAEQTAGAFETDIVYVITAVGTTDFTAIGASANTIGVEFTASGAGTGTGTATPLRPIISDTTPTADKQKIAPTYEQIEEGYQPLIDTENVETSGIMQGKMLINSYTAAQTLTFADHNASIVQMTTADEVTMWDCETAGVGAFVMLWARDAEKIEVVPASGDHFNLFAGTALTADYELDMAATAGTKVTLMCTADDTWSVYSETAASVDGGAAD